MGEAGTVNLINIKIAGAGDLIQTDVLSMLL
jgi:hypothetical protein